MFYFKFLKNFKTPVKFFKKKNKISLYFLKKKQNYQNFDFFFNYNFKNPKILKTKKLFKLIYKNICLCENFFFFDFKKNLLYSFSKKVYINDNVNFFLLNSNVYNPFFLYFRKNFLKKKNNFFKRFYKKTNIISLTPENIKNRLINFIIFEKSKKIEKYKFSNYSYSNNLTSNNKNICILFKVKKLNLLRLKFNFLFKNKLVFLPKNNFFSFFHNNYYSNLKTTLKVLHFLNDFYINNYYTSKYNNSIQGLLINKNTNVNFLKSYNPLNKNGFIFKTDNNKFFNNYYPIVYFEKKKLNLFFSKYRVGPNINYSIYMHFYILSFLENIFKKNFFLKTFNNNFQKIKEVASINLMYNNYKNYKPKFLKKFSITDLIEIIWYSFLFKDLNMLSNWFCNLLELTKFLMHRKILIFFGNFIKKYSNLFMKDLNIKGFFFDIRGKVGVAGNSKKRHFFFKFGKLSRSTKKSKMNFKQAVVRTPSGAMGVTFLLNF